MEKPLFELPISAPGDRPGGHENFSRNMTSFPPAILNLFKAREEIKFIPRRIYNEKLPYGDLSQYLSGFENENSKEKIKLVEPRWKIKKKKIVSRLDNYHKLLKIRKKEWDPKKDEKVLTDPYSTLFVCRLNYKTDETVLRREFSEFGKIKSIRIVRDQEGKSRGYAFVEFENSSDMKRAYRFSEHKIIDGKPVLVDVERARICLPKWKPRRLGGGLGTTRKEQLKKVERERLERLQKLQKGRRVFGSGGGGRRGGFRGGGRFRGGGGGRRGGFRGGGRFGGRGGGENPGGYKRKFDGGYDPRKKRRFD